MPGTGAGSSYGDLLVMSLVVLGGVSIAAFVLVRVVGRFLTTGRARGSHLMDVVARIPLEPRRSLYVVEVAGKTLLVGTSEMGLSVLTELDGAEVRARTVARPTFADLVRGAWDRHHSARSSRPSVEHDNEVTHGESSPVSSASTGSLPMSSSETSSSETSSSETSSSETSSSETSSSGTSSSGASSSTAPGGSSSDAAATIDKREAP